MKLKILALRDRQTDQFDKPMFMLTIGQAIRGLADEVNRQAADNPLWAHPEDYELFDLGEWETQNARFKLNEEPQSIALCSNLKR